MISPILNEIAGVPIEFVLFGLTLIGVALFHRHTLLVAFLGLISILILKIGFQDFNLQTHLEHEWSILANLFGLLLGFAILAHLFEDTHIPKLLPKYLPDDWKGPFYLILIIFILSSFLDNIAAAIIGGSIAHIVFRGKVHIGYIVAIVGASNAGGSGSVLGDTTTTMMWVDGVAATDVLKAYIAAVPAVLIFGYFASKKQHSYHQILKGQYKSPQIDYKKLLICILILLGAILSNLKFGLPAIGVWIAILIGVFITKIDWTHLQKAFPGSLFLILLVLSASMMPVDKLPDATWQSAFILGFISSVFDNIPLTKLALDQLGYDWGVLAYCVGFGGSMLWFGSSAGVAITNLFPEAKSVKNWLKHGWIIIVAYVIGFAIMLLIAGWHPHDPHKSKSNKEIISKVNTL